MGYTTEFSGTFQLDKPLSKPQIEYINKFCKTRRMKRDPIKLQNFPDPIREDVDLPIGVDGEYFVGAKGSFGQSKDGSIIDYNTPPSTQPGLWCQWQTNDDGTTIEWNLGEKFYDYTDWLRYIINNFLIPWGYVLNGTVRWRGEDFNDIGIIKVENNKITVEELQW
jgi:hypothetical protein